MYTIPQKWARSLAHFFCMDARKLLEKVESVVTPVIEGLGFELIDSEYLNEQGRLVLRLYVDKPLGGISIGECADVSRAVAGVLDVEDVVPQRYNLEVSSPGLNRPLKKLADFERFAGQNVRLKTKEPIQNRANYFGILKGIKGNNIIMVVDGVEYDLPHDMVAKAKIEHKF